MYKQEVRAFRSMYVPHALSYLLCRTWERYSAWSQGQLPPVFNRRRWHAEMKRTKYSNSKIKSRLGWRPKISTQEGMAKFFQGCREKRAHA
jgi:nucleoside-diphosphate-sugar epimerase